VNGTVLFMQNIINNSPGVHVIHRSIFNANQPLFITRTSYNSQTFPFLPGNYFEMLITIQKTFWEVIYI